MTGSSSEALRDAARRIERWLLTSPLQVCDGENAGGVAGWLDRQGRPVFVYLEITGYYLTTMAWLLAGGARDADSAFMARHRGRHALGWFRHVLDGGALPPTRMYLAAGNVDDWRNAAVFSFDLAMAIRGVSAFSQVAGLDYAATAAAQGALADRVEEIRDGQARLPNHRTLGHEDLPSRWSTRAGPHHIKAAAALLPLRLDDDLLAAASATWTHWVEKSGTQWPVQEVHPLLYGLEGMAMKADASLGDVEVEFKRLMRAQDSAGWLPETLGDATTKRSDVLAQALRIGALLRACGHLQGREWASRLNLLADRLLEHVRTDGSVGFSLDQDIANAWCAMFAHQALVLHDAGDESTAALVRRYLV